MKRIIITGGAGFIGTWLSAYFLGKGHKVYCIDDLSTGLYSNTRPFSKKPGYQFHDMAIDELTDNEEFFEKSDWLIHLASPVGVRLIVNEENVDQVIQSHLSATQKLYDLAGTYGLQVFFSSSSEIYGKRLDVYEDERIDGLTEDKNGVWGALDKTRWWYAHLKKCSEDLLLDAVQHGKLHGNIGRLFNVTGPYQRPTYGMVVPRFIQMALNGQPITVYGDGSQVRSFCSVVDCVEAITTLLEMGKKLDGQIFNIGRNEPVTMWQLAEKVNRLTGNPTDAIIKKPFEDIFNDSFEEIFYRVPNTDKLFEHTGYRLKTPLDEILSNLIAFSESKSEQPILK